MPEGKRPLKIVFLSVMAAMCIVLAAESPSYGQAKRIAVMQFDDGTAGTRNMNIGAKVADVLLSKLAGSGTFVVVDRDYVQKIIQEQNLKMDSRFDAAGAAKIGKLANVDALIVGQVTAFNANVETQKKQNFVSNKMTSVGTIELKVTARLISVETGAILCAPTANVEQKQVLSESTSSNLIQGVSSDNTSNVQSGLLKLVDKSVDEVSENLAKQIGTSAGSIPGAHGPAATMGKVIGIEDGLVLVNRGVGAGIKVGDKFSIVRSVDTGMKDPDTGKPVLRKKKICSLAISETEDSLSSGKCDGILPLAGDEMAPIR